MSINTEISLPFRESFRGDFLRMGTISLAMPTTELSQRTVNNHGFSQHIQQMRSIFPLFFTKKIRFKGNFKNII